MPYISQEDRNHFNHKREPAYTPGELNYLLTKTIIDYVKIQQAHDEKLSYSTLNAVLGALEGAKAEFIRRVLIPFEEKKLEENGDVYPKELIS